VVEYCYQTKKRHQTFPIAQVVGRTDLALFPVAGYLVRGSPDATALLCFLFFYPWALAHLGVGGAAAWVTGFAAVHAAMALVFGLTLGPVAIAGFGVGLILLGAATCLILRGKSPTAAMRALPLIHATLIVYAAAIIAATVL
jgi:4-hydroxybenzoate polyprenyltransferase